MADDLDDLFGAFDEQDDSTLQSDPEPKKAKLDTSSGTVQEATIGKADKTVVHGDNNVKEESRDTRSAKEIYTSVMNTTMSSASSVKKTEATHISKEAESKSPVLVNGEIATGTSHDKSVRSYSAYPKNLPAGHRLAVVTPPKEPAKKYSFTLDPFQQQAVNYIDKEESVLVAAHTSAGKTAVAEYAISKSLKQGQRVVYTSPIKALSNQKFRDLQEEFGDVGLMTGDMTINPEATALVMTTEILRSMLYRGSELMREVAWVIYDEVHYMRDSERGVVWEESIILLPHRVRFVFLSATIPNANQFADWIAEIHHQPCHVVYTNYRPTPLQHYIFPQGGDGLHLVVDEQGKFRETNFQKAMASLQSGNVDAAAAEAMLQSGNSKKRGRSSGAKKNNPSTDLHRIVKLVMERNLNPVIVFSFSKRDCEKYALALNQEDYTDDTEKDLITQVYVNAIESLGEEDRKLPQVEALLPLLKRGIGIHHGGLLPILKEIVEILFSEGLTKILFATETFSIGINMPAKTVIFTVLRKWDGKDFRWLSCGEYTQMSGRAGRRGLDKKGTVIQMLDEKMDPTVCKDILYGVPDPLNSSYRISYNMLLNLMRVEDVDPEYLLRASFLQYQREREAPALLARAEALEAEAQNINLGSTEDAELAGQYFQMNQQLHITRKKMLKFVQKPAHILKFVQTPGRLLDIVIDGESFGWGVLTSCKKKPGTGSAGEAGRMASQSGPQYLLDVLLFSVDRRLDSAEKAKEEDPDKKGILWRGTIRDYRPAQSSDDNKVVSMRVFTVTLENVERLSAVRLYIPQDVSTPEARKKVATSVVEVKKRLPEGLPLIDPVTDMGIKDESFQTLIQRADVLNKRLSSHKLVTDYGEVDRLSLVESHEKKANLLEQAKTYREEARKCQTIAMKDDLKKMKRVLKRLGHVDADGVIQTKGRTACEINTATELVVVDLMFTGVFNDLTVEQSVALLSCMTYDERHKDEDDPTKGMNSLLLAPFHKLQEVARTVAKVEIACGVDIVEDEFVEKFNPGMMEAVFAWCNGAKFIEVQKLTGSYEGTTIRTLRRLEELVRQIGAAAKAIGNVELQTKFEKGSDLIKRDIVFCSSLYL